MPNHSLTIAGMIVALIWCSESTVAQWSTNPSVNNMVGATATDAWPVVISDKSGGAIIAWQDYRTGTPRVYTQRISTAGHLLWSSAGVPVDAGTGQDSSPVVASDGEGGVIVAWQDNRGVDADIYAQRISASGSPLWTGYAIAVCTASHDQIDPVVVADGAGGAIVVWEDYRDSTSYNIYAQRINSSGACLWTTNGVAVCLASRDQKFPVVVDDGAEGEIVTWVDYRGGLTSFIYAQRIDTSGAVRWSTDGVSICSAPGDRWFPRLVSDGAHGAIVTWYDSRNSSTAVYAQRVNGSGVAQWDSNGVRICTSAGSQMLPEIVSDGMAGAIITWQDYRSGATADVYAQHVGAGGNLLWSQMGNPICASAGDQFIPRIASDENGGAIITWEDHRSISGADIYAQSISAGGVVQWPVNGAPICSADLLQDCPAIIADGVSGAIVVWVDHRGGSTVALFAQRIDQFGRFTRSERKIQDGPLTFALLQNYPNPFNPTTIIGFTVPFRSKIVLSVYNVLGQNIATIVNEEMGAGYHEHTWKANVSSGIYFYKIVAVSLEKPATSFVQTRKMILLH
jgi:hypothetical protein